MTPDENHRPARRWPGALLAVFMWVGMFAWSHVPPYRGNILEQKRDFLVWHWQLYSRGGEGICDVRYFDMKEGGAPIERWALLGYERPGEMPEKIARTDKEDLYGAYRRVCGALREQGVPAPEVEVQARCASHGKWRTVERRKRNVCAIKKRAKNKSKSQPKSKLKSKAGG